MPVDKAVRQFTLLMLLHSRKSAIGRAEIFERLAHLYPDGDDARERMFERDKQDLRALGVVLDAVEDPFLEDFIGYKVNYAQTHELRVHFTPDEAHAVSIASKLWQGTAYEAAVEDAALRVQAVADPLRENSVIGRISFAPLPESIALLVAAVGSRSEVTFDYRKPEDGQPQRRRVQPWAVFAQGGHWLLVGYDPSRGDRRRFRLDRMTTAVTVVGQPAAYDIPTDFDVAAEFDGDGVRLDTCTVKVRPQTCWALRRMASVSAESDDGWQRLEITDVNEVELAGQIASHAPDAVPLAPTSLVAAVRQRLEAVGGFDGR